MKTLFFLLSLVLFANNALAYQTKSISFTSHGEKIVGTLYLPDTVKKGQKIPAVIVTGAWTTVKEQMPKNYAIELTKRNYAALTFDFRGWGQSSGKIFSLSPIKALPPLLLKCDCH